MTIEARYSFEPKRGEHGEWLGVVFEKHPGDVTVVHTVGVEDSEEAIKSWLELALEREPWVPGNPPAPDKYDRAKKNA